MCSLEEGKLGILAKCKKEFAVSPYLESNIFTSYKRAIAKFRTSAHKFPIEVDRYSNIPRESRVCIFCCNTVGDEGHYLFDCMNPGIRDIYLPFLNRLFPSSDNTFNLNNDDRVLILAKTDNESLWTTGKLCYKVLSRYNEITN